MASDKWKYFTFLVYPESAPKDWKEKLRKSHGCFAISPLHDSDDEHGKPHYHVIYMHSNTIGMDGARKAIPENVMANDYFEAVRAPRNMQRYLIHLDDPEKQQFENGAKAIEILNGFPLDLSRDFSPAERREQRRKVHELIRDMNIFEYSDLLDYLLAFDLDLYDYASNHTILFNTYITSRRNKFEMMKEND